RSCWRASRVLRRSFRQDLATSLDRKSIGIKTLLVVAEMAVQRQNPVTKETSSWSAWRALGPSTDASAADWVRSSPSVRIPAAARLRFAWRRASVQRPPPPSPCLRSSPPCHLLLIPFISPLGRNESVAGVVRLTALGTSRCNSALKICARLAGQTRRGSARF
ncbi:unnamed protein product, partial [Prorocentrum cordatum]